LYWDELFAVVAKPAAIWSLLPRSEAGRPDLRTGKRLAVVKNETAERRSLLKSGLT